MSNTQNTVTPETALRLKAAGLPQPEIEPGQVWYGIGKFVQVIEHNIEDSYVEYITDSRRETMDSFASYSFSGFFAFCPTIPDLLSELGKIVIRRTTRKGKFVYNVEKRVSNEEIDAISDTNLAEALALMWENLNANAQPQLL